jgi:hypothetical protein
MRPLTNSTPTLHDHPVLTTHAAYAAVPEPIYNLGLFFFGLLHLLSGAGGR